MTRPEWIQTAKFDKFDAMPDEEMVLYVAQLKAVAHQQTIESAAIEGVEVGWVQQDEHGHYATNAEIDAALIDMQDTINKMNAGPRRDPKRIWRMMHELERTWSQVPDMRLGQLVECIAGCNQFYMEDDEMLDRIIEFGRGFTK